MQAIQEPHKIAVSPNDLCVLTRARNLVVSILEQEHAFFFGERHDAVGLLRPLADVLSAFCSDASSYLTGRKVISSVPFTASTSKTSTKASVVAKVTTTTKAAVAVVIVPTPVFSTAGGRGFSEGFCGLIGRFIP